MNLSKQAEKELLLVYNSWWESYLNGDIPTYDSFLDDDFRFVGSTDGEEFLNRKGSTSFFEATADQLAGKAKLGNIVRTIEPIDSIVLITDLADAYVLDGNDWVYYARFRFTSLMRNTSNGWRFFYQHFSTPDVKAEEGETLGIDKISSENLELRNAIKRRTAELEIKNRDLEVEASLERIRAQVTAMSQSSDLLDIVVSMRTEFVNLGHEAHYFWQMRWLAEKYQKAMTSGDGARIGMIMELPRDFHSHYEGMTEWENNDEPIIVLALETEIAVDYIDKMIKQGNFQLVDPNAPSLDDVRHIGGLTFVSARTAHGEIGYSLPGVVKNPPKEDLDILVRFAGAFDLAHKRFEDLQKSEKQAREVQIELGLEKVRSRAMAMQDSSELSQLVDTVFKELAILDFALQACIINLIDIDNLCNTVWMKSPDVGSIPDSYFMKFEDYPFHDAMKEGYLRRKAKYIYTIQGAEKKEYDKYLFKDTEFRKIAQEAQDSFTSLEKYVCSFTFSNFGGIQTIGEEPLSDENLDILARFGKVFDLTYTRFNDLKLAEAQARESRIELSLERVRARTMAMQHSEELAEVATILFQQVGELGIPQWTCGFNIWETGDTHFTFYPGGPDGEILASCKVPLMEHPIFRQFHESKKRGDELLVYEKEGEIQADHYRYMHSLPGIGDMLQGMLDSGLEFPTYQIDHVANFLYGNIIFITYEAFPEMHDVFKRFAKVFEQTYTRFLDLQKAEAQAKEAQIEAALERIRSKSMSMSSSKDIGDTVATLFHESVKIGHSKTARTGIGIFDDSNYIKLWSAITDQEEEAVLRTGQFDMSLSPSNRKVKNAWKRGDKDFYFEMKGPELINYYKAINESPDYDLAVDLKSLPQKEYWYQCYFKYGLFYAIDKVEVSKETKIIFNKFSQVFEQVYTRFLDLQKAENQAREAQIETSLERVRSRSIGMQNSEELKEVIQVIFDQLSLLNINAEHAGIVVDYKAKEDWHFWVAETQDIPSRITIPYLDSVWDRQFTEAKKKGKDFFTTQLDFEEKNKFYEKMLPYITGLTKKARNFYLTCPGLAASTVIQKDIGLYIENFSGITYTDEENSILLRIGKVFQQTYTRFLDLQKAEEQAKEARIETSLERVRSRTMGMQRSEELVETAILVQNEFRELGFNQFFETGYILYDEENYSQYLWMSNFDGSGMEGLTLPMVGDKVLQLRYDAWKRKDPVFCVTLEGETLVKHIEFIMPLLSSEDMKDQVKNKLPDPTYLYSGNFSHGFLTVVANEKLSEEQEFILARFSGVFEQTYIRFLDLQKAEAQAREAQIEAALEKVRSRSLVVQRSDEFNEVVSIVFEKLKELQIPATAVGIAIKIDGSKDMNSFVCGENETGLVITNYRLPYFNNKISKDISNALEKQLDFYVGHYSKKEKNSFYKYVLEHTAEFSHLPDDIKRMIFESPSYTISMVAAKHSLFNINDFEGKDLSENDIDIIKRFTKVFDQAYTRFLDLKKSEAQAREAQIESALERVRSRTIGMQKSDELREVIQVIHDELIHLNFEIDAAGFTLDYHQNNDWNTWIANKNESLPSLMSIPYIDHPQFNYYKSAKEKGLDFLANTLSFDEKNSIFTYMFGFMGDYSQAEKDELLSKPGLAISQAFLKNISLWIYNLDAIPYSVEDNNTLMRFAKVFEQTYTRFLDLQKAEAQAREAQIEMALEKVRSRTMAMQNSSELPDAANNLFFQVQELGIPAWSAGYCIWEDDQKSASCNMSSEGVIQKGFSLPTIGEGYNFDKPFKDKEAFHVAELGGKALVKHYDFMKTLPIIGEVFEDFNEKGIVLPSFQIFHIVYFTHGYLMFITYEAVPQEWEIFKRFGKVFEQTFTRFLDLQKAEAQAREARIETALERVRSRTMAMHNSSELAETAAVLFQQLKELGVDHDRTNIGIVDVANGKINFWLTTQKGNLVDKIFPASIDESNTLKTIYKGYKEKRKSIIVEQKGAELKRWISFITDKLGIPYTPPTRNEIRFQSVGYISQGMLIATSTNPLNEESVRILERFAAVFEQTYTRFLDLQKAEAQAIEAQIEAALEKVRSRSLAMQKPEELQEVVAVVAEKLKELGVIFDAGGVILCTYFPDNKDVMHWIAVDDFSSSGSYFVPYFDNPIFNDAWDSKIKGDAYFSKEFPVKAKNEFFKHAFKNSDYRYFPDDYKQHVLQADKHNLSAAWSKNSAIIIPSLTGAIPSESDAEIMKRFAKVFEQAYIRFMDLQKAEAQAREAQIEAALERTRNQSMQMQHSDEIKDLSKIFHEQLHVLNIPSEFSYVWLPEEQKEEHMFWATWSETTKGSTSTLSKSVVYPLDKSEPYTAACYKAWTSEEPVHETKIIAKETAKFFDIWKELLNGAKKLKARYFPEGIYYAEAYMKYGCFGINIRRALENDEADILHRFAIEFERAYTRFLDLKRAEAQTTEVRIEAALERVRSKTMAMHSSSDVKETVKTFFDEVLKLGIDKTIRCGIGILEGHEGMETWSANATKEGEVEMRVGMLNMNIHPMLRGLKKAWKNGEKGYSYYYTQKDVLKYYTALNNEPEYPFNADLDHLPKREYHNSFFFSSGIIFAFAENPMTEESSAVLHRFAEVFGQTYRRYLDLRKAEAQAKEAQIEAALEKVRSRTMAMQASSELQEAAHLLFLEVRALGIDAWSAGYNILNEDKTQSECWMSSLEELQDPFSLKYTEEGSFIEMGAFLKSEEDFLVQELAGKDLEQHYAYMKSLPELKHTFRQLEDAGLSVPTHQVNHLCKFSKGYLLFITYESVPKAHDIFKRFTKVFEQTYTRFLDLQKAENQSKEAQIELALERVRASSMAMHKSEQLAETAEVLFEQFDLLGIIPDRISIAIYNEKKRLFELWSTDQNGTRVSHGQNFSIDEPTCISKTYKAWKDGKETFTVDLKGKELKDWVRYVKEEAKMELDESQFQGRRVQHAAFFSQGYLLLSSHLPISNETEQLLVRFTKVFQQTYTRFLDLKKAENQAREAIKRASVDRIRAEIASMRTGTDLNRITPLVWNELTTLDVPFIRCGVFIMDEETQQVQTHLSTPEGKAIASFELPFENTAPLEDLVLYWRKNEMYTDYWDESAFVKSINILMQRGKIESAQTYMTENQPTCLHLHFLPFLQGMLYVGSEVSLTKDELSLVQNLAEAFSSAYARYEDFNKLELANIKIEKTLVDLKQAQSQLVQSEKMASLGELTAGIAHEIQNPLNFVNNFSEVSQELMEEMYEEIKNGDLEEALEIGNDIEQNLEKIHHHGRRASEIVKGMLQHSRSSSGVRELTDINALADEYLRLAYHGLRAKDKTFNATMETHFDEKLTKIEVIPQDIGRVILNLITNAFYAVDQKKKQEIDGYEPKVTIHTKRTKKGNEISVSDNGNGIPQKVLDKIFQPFFTTKPTGQGTGLGLSLSYDIITAHGGELKVETKEEVGTTFIIQLTTL